MAKTRKTTKRAPAGEQAKARPAAKKAVGEEVKPIPAGYHTVTPTSRSTTAPARWSSTSAPSAPREIDADGGARRQDRARRDPGSATRDRHAERRVPGHELRKAPTSLGGTTGSLMLYVPNVDAAFKRATDAGGKSIMAPTDMFWGDRFGKRRTIRTATSGAWPRTWRTCRPSRWRAAAKAAMASDGAG